GHGAAEGGLEAGGVGVGQVVGDRGLATQGGAGAGHREVEGLVHAGLGVAAGPAPAAPARGRCNLRAAPAPRALPAATAAGAPAASGCRCGGGAGAIGACRVPLQPPCRGGAARAAGGHSRRRAMGQRMLMTVWVSASWAWIICALAWQLRCAVIMFTSCSVRLTLEASSAPPWIIPNSAVPAAPRRARPEAWVSAQALSPTGCRPCGLAKLVSATWPSGVDTPLV